MAPRYRSLNDPAVSEYLDEIPKAPIPSPDQIAAASKVRYRSPRAQRLAQGVIGDTARQADAQQREAEQFARENQREQEKAAKEQAAAVEAERAMQVRAGAAAGMKTETDIATGKTTIATHPDGEPVWTPKKLGNPIEVGTEYSAIKFPGEEEPTTRPFANPLIADHGGATSAMGGTSKAIIKQPFRNDRGELIATAPNATTDASTGWEYVSRTNPATGEISKIATGIDQAKYDQVQRDRQYQARAQEIAMRDNEIKQQRFRFDPAFKPVAREMDEANKKLAALPPKFTKQGGIWRYTDPETLKEVTTYDAREVERNLKLRELAEQRHARAKEAFDRMAPTNGKLDRAEKEIAAAKLKLDADKLRMDAGLPEDDGGVAKILARAQAGETVYQDEVDAAMLEAVGIDPRMWSFQGESGAATPRQYPERPTTEDSSSVATTEPGTITEERPLIPADPNKAALVTEAFQGLVNPAEFTVGHEGEGYTFIKRNGEHVGRIVTEVGEKSLKSPVLIINDNLRQTGDIRQYIAFGGTKGIDIYLGSNARPDPVKEAEWTAGVFGSLRKAQQAGAPDAVIAGLLKEAGADTAGIFRKVRHGELSLKRGEAIMRDLYGTTLKADDPLEPGAMERYMTEDAPADLRARYEEAKASRDTAAMNAVSKEFINNWFLENRAKPGVTLDSKLIAEKALQKELRGGEKAANFGAAAGEMGASSAGMMATLFGLHGYQFIGDAATQGTGKAWDRLSDKAELIGRGFTNTNRSWAYNTKRWFTPEGKRIYSEHEEASNDLKYKILAQDAYKDGVEDPRFQSEFSQLVDSTIDSAMALHTMGLFGSDGREEGWEITREDLEKLNWMPAAAAISGDMDLLEQWRQLLLQDHGTRQAEAMTASLTSGQNRYLAAFTAGSVAPPQEIIVEAASWALTAGVGKVVYGGAKSAQLAAKAAQAGATASRIQKMRGLAAGAVEGLKTAGMKTGTLAAPLGTGAKVSNQIVKGAKVMAAGAVTNAPQEAVMSVADRNATAQSVMHDFVAGGAFGAVMPIVGAPLIPLNNMRQNAARQTAARKYADLYNRANRDTPNFVPLSPENAETAMALLPDDTRKTLIENRAAAQQKLIRATELAEKYPNNSSAQNNHSRAIAEAMEASDQIALAAARQVEAVKAVESLPEAERPRARAILKVASGRADLLTAAERATVAGATTATGNPYFANVNGVEYLTAEARAELAANNSPIAGIVRTDESQALTDAAFEAAQPISQPGQAADASGAQGDPATGGVVPPHVSDAAQQPAGLGAQSPAPTGTPTGSLPNGQAPPAGNGGSAPISQNARLAGMEKLGYDAAKAVLIDIPSEADVVSAAIAESAPVHVSMAKAAGIDMAAQGYVRQGSMWNAPVKQEKSVEPKNGSGTGNAPQGQTPGPVDQTVSTPPEMMTATQYEQSGNPKAGIDIVKEALAAKKPVSVDMARKFLGISKAPDGYIENGSVYEPYVGGEATAFPLTEEQRKAGRELAAKVKQAIEARSPNLNVSIIEFVPDHQTGGVQITLNGGIELVSSDMVRETLRIGTKKTLADPAAYFEQLTMKHEVMHLAQIGVAREKHAQTGSNQSFEEFFQDYYAKFFQDINGTAPNAVFIGSQRYGQATWSRMKEWRKGAELFRMIGEDLISGESSEILEAAVGKNPNTLEQIKELIAYLTKLVLGKADVQLSEESKRHALELAQRYSDITGIPLSEEAQALYQEMTQQAAKPPATPQPQGKESDKTPDKNNLPIGTIIRSKVYSTEGDIRILKGPFTNRDGVEGVSYEVIFTGTARSGNLQARFIDSIKSLPETAPTAEQTPAAPTLMQLLGQAFTRAIEANPEIAARRLELFDLLDELSDALEGLPPAQIEAELDRQLGEWIAAQKETQEAQQAALDEAKSDEKSRKARAARLEREAKITAKADKLLAGTRWLGELVRQGIRIELPPNIISLMLARKRKGQRLTQNEIDTLRAYTGGEYDGLPRQSMFPGGGRNTLMRNIIARITAPNGSPLGIEPDKAAQALEEPFGQKITVDDFLQEIDRELRALSRGESLTDSRSPDFEGDEESIAKADAAAAMEAEEAENEAEASPEPPQAAPLPSLPEVITSLREAYGEDMDLAKKLEIAQTIIADLPEPMRQAITYAAIEEEQRIAYGVLSAAKWQEMNPGLNVAATWFQRLLDNQTPATIRATLNNLRKPENQQVFLERMALGSSPTSRGAFASIAPILENQLSKPPSEYQYETTNESSTETRDTLDFLGDVQKTRIDEVTSSELSAQLREVERATGATIRFFKSSSEITVAGFTPLSRPDLIFINADRADMPLSAIIAHELTHIAQKDSRANARLVFREILDKLSEAEFVTIENALMDEGYPSDSLEAEIPAFVVADAISGHNTIGLPFYPRGEELRANLKKWFYSLPTLKPDAKPGARFADFSQGSFDFGATGEMGTKNQLGFNFDGPRTKAKQNAQVAFDKAPEGSPARARIATQIAKTEGLADPAKFVKQATQQPAFGFNDTTAATRDQLGLFSSPSQRAFDFGASGSFNTRNQLGLDFGGTSERTPSAPKSPETKQPQGKEKDIPKNKWVKFPENETLGIPRAEMPQVEAGNRSALVQFLKARGIDYAEAETLPGRLKPTQAEYSPEKVQKAREYEGGDRAILVDKTNRVVDGHHQWMAKLDNPTAPIRVIRFNARVQDLLPRIKEMPSTEVSTETAPAQPEPQDTAKPAKPPQAPAAPQPGTPDFRLLPVEDKREIVKTKLEAKAAEKAGISDFGEKIGGARKDLATKSGDAPARRKSNDKPGWFNRYEIGEVVAEDKPTTALESYLARANGIPTGEKGRFVIHDTRKKDYFGKPVRATRQSFATREEAEAAIPMLEVSRNHRVRGEKVGEDYQYGIWRDVTDRKRVQVVKQTFGTEKEAMEFMAKNAADIIETKTSWREELIVKPENPVRSGKQRRTGPATPEMFQNAFGFRGVEFGNWMRQAGDGKERQEVLNHAYDGLLDLADTLGIPPRAISLNGDLGLAFGARGQGLSGAKAHYEMDYVVINLTKMSGAGSLAHEWIHALDHYFGRQDGRASSEWSESKKTGDRVLKTKGAESDMASQGFSRDSSVREEVRNAYIRLMDTIMRKSVEYVEDSNNAEKFVAATRKGVEDEIARIRRDYTRTPDPRWEKRRKPATEAQLAVFDSIADRIVNGQDLKLEWRSIEGGKSRYGNSRWTNDALEQLGEIHKAITNRSGFQKEGGGTLDNLRGQIKRYADRIAMLESAAASETKVKKVPTDFSMNAKRIDQGSASDYWNTPHEMLARAFSAYVEDRISDTGGKSDFLSYGSDNNLAKYRLFNVKPFPEGKERETINTAFDNLFAAIETKETDKGIALFSSPSQQPDLFTAASAPDAREKLGDVKVGRMNALGAYRALTAKRDKVGLTATEEQQLLDAEVALGQKLAFDMEGLKGAAPASDKDSLTVATPPPAALGGSLGGQSEMMMAGETERGGQMRLFSAPSPELLRRPHFHATSSEEAGKSILADGIIKPPMLNGKKGKLVPVEGRVYMSGQRETAAIYSLGGVMMGHKYDWQSRSGRSAGQYGYIFEIDPASLRDVQPDEDSIGELVNKSFRNLSRPDVDYPLWLRRMADRHATPTQIRNVKEGMYADFAALGKKLVKLMSDEQKLALIDGYGAHVAAEGQLRFIRAWRVDKAKSERIDKDGMNLFDVAELVHGDKPMRLFSSPTTGGRYAARRPENPFAYTYRTEYQGGELKHIVRAYNQDTFTKEDRVFDTRKEAQAEMDRLDDDASEVAPDQIAKLLGLASSPSADNQAALDMALNSMRPIYRAVWEDIQSGKTPEQITQARGLGSRAVTNILDQIRARTQAALQAASKDGLKPAMRDGKFEGGRPDLALSTIPEVAAIDQNRNDSGVPDVRPWAEVLAEAEQELAADYQGTYDRMLGLARDMKQMTDKEVAMSKMIIARETKGGNTDNPAERVKLAMLIHGYRDIGTETARSLAIRRDPHKSPADRHAQFIAEALFSPDDKTAARLRKASPGQQESILAEWMRRVDAIKAELKASGLDIDASLAAHNAREQAKRQAAEENPRAAAVIEESFRKLTRIERTVVEAIRSGSTYEGAAFLVGMDKQDAKDIYAAWVGGVREAMKESAKRYLSTTLASSPMESAMSSIMEELGIPDPDLVPLDEADRPRVEAEKEARKPRKPKTPKPATETKTKAEKMLGVGDKPLTDKQKAAIERFVNAAPSTWKVIRQETGKLFPQSEGFPADYAEGENARRILSGLLLPDPINEEAGTWDETRPFLGQGELLRDPINETTGTFDMNDPIALMRVAEAFSVARGTTMDKVMEFWRMSILTGPQTHLVGTGSNALNAAYNLLPRRAVEAGTNTLLSALGLGTPQAATFSEFSAMMKHARAAAQLGARQLMRSWKAENRIFDAYAEGSAYQVDFMGVGNEQFAPKLGGKLGKLMRSLSFRAMTAADEGMKHFYGTLEAAAQAHRIAKVEEKLTGAAYESRVKALMQPGSKAWVRASDEAKRITFQTELDGTNPRMIARIDQLAELAKKGRAMPWIGRPLTFFLPFIDFPTNIVKEAIEMSPIGGALAVIDGTRALRRRYMRGKMSQDQAEAEIAKLYDRARFVRDVTNQTIAWTAYFAIAGLLEPDDDDEDGRPFITGTQPYKTTKRGVRDNAYAVMPAQSLRIGDTVFSYSRVEPFASMLAGVADLIQEINRNGGKLSGAAASAYAMRLKDQFKDKTFLQGVSDLINAIEDPSRFLENTTSNIVTGFVPNIIRQPIREMDSNIRDTRPREGEGVLQAIARRVGYSIVPQAAPVKMDVWGNEIKANRGDDLFGSPVADAIKRALDPLNSSTGANADPIDAWIYRYNAVTADSADRIGIQALPDYVMATVDGKRVKLALTPEEQAEANRNAGKAARAALGDDWDWKGAESADAPAKAEFIVETVKAAQSAERDRLRQKKLAEIQAAE